MSDVIAIPKAELPDELITKFKLARLLRRRGDSQEELWFFERERYSLLPIWHHGQLLLTPWGTKTKSSKLPLGGSCRQEDLEAGNWAWLRPEPIEIVATFARSNGFWYDVPQGIRGIAVQDASGRLHTYMLLAAATHYFRTMTRSDVEPVFIGPQI